MEMILQCCIWKHSWEKDSSKNFNLYMLIFNFTYHVTAPPIGKNNH